MMKQEFERLAKIEVTEETYTKIIEPMYMATELSKQDFINLLNLKVLEAPKVKDIKKMRIRDRSGCSMTPNGCWYHVKWVELIDVDIATGKFIVKPLDDSDRQRLADEGHDLHYAYDYDFDYLMCIDTQKKPIALGF